MTTAPTLDHLRLRLGRNLFEADRANSEAGVSRLTSRTSVETVAELGDPATGAAEEAVGTPESPSDPGAVH